MNYAADLSAEASETTTGKFRERFTHLALKTEGKN